MSTPDDQVPPQQPPQPPQPPQQQQPLPPQQPPYGTPPTPSAYDAPAAPPYGSAPAYPPAGPAGYPTGPKTNTLAIVSLISSIAGFVFVPFIGALVGVITGHMALNQLKTSGENGRGLALAGTIMGWAGLALAIIGTIFFVIAWFWVIGNAGEFRNLT